MKHANPIITAVLMASVCALQAGGKTKTIVFAETGLEAGDLQGQSPISMGQDLAISFHLGGALTTPKISSSGAVTLTQGSVMSVSGKSTDVLITGICMQSEKKSQTFSAGAASCTPTGTFTIDKELFTSTWTDAAGANTITISSMVGAPVFTSMTVTYSGGNDPGDPDPGPEPEVTGLSPKEAVDLTLVPDPMGALCGALSFTAPTEARDGTPLEGIFTGIIYRNGKEISRLDAVAGQRLSYEDVLTRCGEYTYMVKFICGNNISEGVSCTGYIGVGIPKDVSSFSAEETLPGIIAFSWGPVEENVSGYPVMSGNITYTIRAGYETIAEGLTGTSAMLGYPPEGMPQAITDFNIVAETRDGRSVTPCRTETMAVGQPYPMPYFEGFPEGSYTQGQCMEVVEDENNRHATWFPYIALVADEISPRTDDRGLMAFFASQAGESSVLRTPKIHIDTDCNPYLSFWIYGTGNSDDLLEVSVGEEILFTSTTGEHQGWTEMLVPLAAYTGRDIRIAFKAISAGTALPVAIDDIRVSHEPLTENKLVRVRIPYEMERGKEYQAMARVRGAGISPSGYALQVYQGETMLDSWQGEALGRNQEDLYEFSVTVPADAADTLGFTVVLTSDGQQEGNTSQVTSSIRPHGLPQASVTSAGVKEGVCSVSWNRVTLSDFEPRHIEESFESYGEFEINNAGEWQFIDGDQSVVIGIRDGYHGYPNMFEPMAFMVFDNRDGFFPQIGSSTFSAHTGGQCMMSAAVDVVFGKDCHNDDWMISPRLSGERQTVSFYARSSGMLFPEEMEILISDSGTSRTDFRLVTALHKLPGSWTRYEFEAPEGTLYFALRHTGYDQYMLFVDDVSFRAAPVSTQVTGYLVLSSTDGEAWNVASQASPESDSSEFRMQGDVQLKVRTLFANGLYTDSAPVSVSESGVFTLEDCEETRFFDLKGNGVSGCEAKAPVRRGKGNTRVVLR